MSAIPDAPMKLKATLKQYMENSVAPIDEDDVNTIVYQITSLGFEDRRLAIRIISAADELINDFSGQYFKKPDIASPSDLEFIKAYVMSVLCHLVYGFCLQEACIRLGEPITIRTAVRILDEYLRMTGNFEATAFPQTPVDARKFITAFKLKMGNALCSCKKTVTKKTPRIKAKKIATLVPSGYKCHCYPGGNGCPHS